MHHAGRIARESGCPSRGLSSGPNHRSIARRLSGANLFGSISSAVQARLGAISSECVPDGSAEQTLRHQTLNPKPSAPRSKPSAPSVLLSKPLGTISSAEQTLRHHQLYGASP